LTISSSSALKLNPPLEVYECQQAMAVAEATAAQGMWVYSVVYRAGTNSTGKSNLGVTVVAGYPERSTKRE
jgi:hypothetical protein